MDHALRRRRLAERLPDLEVDAFLVTRLPNVRYLTGFTGSNGQLLLMPDDALFLTDSRYAEQSRREVDTRRITYSGDFTAVWAEGSRAAGARRVGFESQGVTYRTYQRLVDAGDGLELAPIEGEIERLRWIKDPDELVLLERAQSLTDEAFERVTRKLAEGVTEREVALELEQEMRRAGAAGLAFDSIVAFGEQAAEPHHRPTERALARGDVVKLDFGCVVDGYHSDMTRTVAFGEPSAPLREVHEAVRRAQEAGVAAVREGASGGDVDEAARSVIRDAGYGDAFGHSLGHGVGLEVHEGPTLRAHATDVLPAGAVVTVEPGVYLPGLGGVRIEDTVLVAAEGGRPLPRSPRELLVL